MPKVISTGVTSARKAAIDVEVAAHELHVAHQAAGRAVDDAAKAAEAENLAGKLTSLRRAAEGVIVACDAAVEA